MHFLYFKDCVLLHKGDILWFQVHNFALGYYLNWFKCFNAKKGGKKIPGQLCRSSELPFYGEYRHILCKCLIWGDVTVSYLKVGLLTRCFGH